MPDNGHLYAAHVINDLWRETRNSNTVVVTDVGQHQMWEAQYFKHEKPRSLITSGGLGTMGFALPAAIGAKVARPDSEVWVIVGDGGFQMTMSELATIQQEKLKINIAIINNGFLGMVRQWQEFFYERNYEATPLLNPNFVKLAEAYGIRSMAVTERSQVLPTVRAAREHDGAVLIDFKVEQEDTVYPMVAAGASLNDMIRRPSPIVETAADERRRIKVKMLNIFVVYVENKPGVLTRVASLFRRRAFNIDSLTVGRTEKPEVSRMTITVDTNPDQAKRIEANLYNLVNVLLVENITHEPAIARDLAMIKVAATHEARSHVLELASVFRARVVDVAPESLTIEITGGEDKIDGLLEVLRPYGVVEMVRTGIVAMRRGTNSASVNPAQTKTPESPPTKACRILFDHSAKGTALAVPQKALGGLQPEVCFVAGANLRR